MRQLPVIGRVPAGRSVELTVDGRGVRVAEGATILDACRALGVDTPTLCFAENLTPVNVCRVCVVELEGSRVLVPACSRRAEAGMAVRTDSERVRLARKVVLELLASSVDTSLSEALGAYVARYEGDPARFGPDAATVAQPVRDDNDLFVRDYARCVLCYKCVEACGDDAQNTFAIAVSGRGFEARIATEFNGSLPESACVFCGNCIGVCPTGALMFRSEHEMRREGTWAPERQSATDTVCPYCGVGCVVTLHVQDDRVVKASSPSDSSVTGGNLCIKGRFGWQYVNTGR